MKDLARLPLAAQLEELPTSGGSPLPAGIRTMLASTTGKSPSSDVRVHADSRSRAAADRLGARAFTIGQQIRLGTKGAPHNQQLLLHEGAHTMQHHRPISSAAFQLQTSHQSDHVEQEAERVATAALAGILAPLNYSSQPVSILRDVVDDVRDKLSYGIIDWAITDAEAMESLALLGSIAEPNLAAELTRLGSKYVTRLLDNLPDAAKTGEMYQRVIRALGPSGAAPYVSDLLSRGLFDWAVTDAEVTRVFNVFSTLREADQEKLLADLNKAGRLDVLVDNSNTAHHALYLRPWIAKLTPGKLTESQKAIVRIIVKESGSGPIETLVAATVARFNVTVGKATVSGVTPVDWEPESLKKTYLALDLLPAAHVEANKELLQVGQFDKPSVKGRTVLGKYSGSRDELAINVRADDVRATVLHEVGHAVDAEMGWSKGPEPAKPQRGGWKDYRANHRDCAMDMVDDSDSGIKKHLTSKQRTSVEREMARAMANRSVAGLKKAIRKLKWFAGLDKAKQGAVLNDPALKAIEVGLKTPWFDAKDGGTHLGSRVYQESYSPSWVRYRHEARSRKLTDYQFRDSGEWFAECYEAYYMPDSRGLGAKLADKDPDTKGYFDSDVNKRAGSR